MRSTNSTARTINAPHPRASLEIIDDNAVVGNDGDVQGAPAFRLLGNNIGFTNTASIINPNMIVGVPAAFAIELVGVGSTIINTATGTIGLADTATIRGSSGNDRIENAGTLAGRIDLGDGNDTIVTTSGRLSDADIELGGGDDRFVNNRRNDAGNNIGGAGGRLSGGEGNDTIVLDRIAAKLWF